MPNKILGQAWSGTVVHVAANESNLEFLTTHEHEAFQWCKLGGQAHVDVEDGKGRNPLDDAIASGNADILPQPSSSSTNQVLMSKVAQALHCAPSLLDQMSKQCLHRFLEAQRHPSKQ